MMTGTDTPYYQFGYQRRYPYAWHGNAGGVPQSRVAASSRSLGIFDMLESGYQDPAMQPFPAFKHTNLHDPSMLRFTERAVATSDWPLLRTAGPEPLDPNQLGMFDLSDNEKKLAVLAIVGAAAYWWYKRSRSRGRRNPGKAKYDVYVGRSKSVSFVNKASAQNYANSLRRDGYKAKVKKR